MLVTTATQTGGQSYTVTVATSVTDTLGYGLIPRPHATFGGYQAPAMLRITEWPPTSLAAKDLLELYVVQGGTSPTSPSCATPPCWRPARRRWWPPATSSSCTSTRTPRGSTRRARRRRARRSTGGATYASNYDSAWDFHGGTRASLYNTSRVLRVKNAQGTTQDAVAFARPSVRRAHLPDPAPGHCRPRACGCRPTAEAPRARTAPHLPPSTSPPAGTTSPRTGPPRLGVSLLQTLTVRRTGPWVRHHSGFPRFNSEIVIV